VHRTELARWQDPAVIERLLHEARTVAVVGLSANPMRPSHGVARYLRRAGLTILPVNPALDGWEGLPSYASLTDIDRPVDVVDVFRAPEAVLEVAEQAVAIEAGALWLQMGVINEAAAELAAAGGLDVVMDRCMAVEHREIAGWG
jgi:predicted CoA-binding protein